MDKVLGRGSPKVDGLCINSNNNYSKRGRGRGLAAWWFEEKRSWCIVEESVYSRHSMLMSSFDIALNCIDGRWVMRGCPLQVPVSLPIIHIYIHYFID